MSSRFGTRTARRIYLALSAGLVCASSLSLSQSKPGDPAQTDPSAFYYGLNDELVAVTVAANRVGVVTREHAARKQVDVIATAFGLRVQTEVSGGLFILTGDGLATRASVFELARKIKAQYPRQIRDAGCVVSLDSDPNPELLTDELLVRFAADKQQDVKGLLDSVGLQIVRRSRGGTFRVQIGASSPFDVLGAAQFLREKGQALFAEPNRHFIAERFETLPTDPFFGNQWHHRNTGASGGTVDADVDTTLAWDITQGSPSTVIAILDNTFDLAHEDLAPNLYQNPGEVAGNGIDDDGNGFVDDVNGWDFVSNDNDPRPVNAGDNHGTAVTGVAVARANNGVGVSGACPNCRFLPLTIFNNCITNSTGCLSSVAAFSDAFDYATFSDAQIISNSWGTVLPTDSASPAVVAAITDATDAGKVVLFAGGNSPSSDYCSAGYPSLPNVIAVSSSSNLDRKVNGHARGNCIDVLAPTRWGGADSPAPTGTLAITTSDRSAGAGYNNTLGACIGGLVEPGNQNYTSCFSGTSSATPLVSGVAGLLLSARPSLTRVQLQRVLQDTTDKIEDSLGNYAEESGFSQPGAGSTHAFGRVNAGEAVRLVASKVHNGVDVMLRDNRLDWGNTEQPSNVTFEPTRGSIGHWKSVDIKIDAPPYQAAPTDNASFEALTDERPKEAELNHVYVRVRNRGPVAASSVTLKLHWTHFGTALPNLPADFWSAFPADSVDTTQWHPLGVAGLSNLAYSGSSVAGCPGRIAPDCGGAVDAAQVASFNWVGPSVPAGTPNHFCLFGVVDSPDDHIAASSIASFVPDAITPTDNNVTHRNVQVELVGGGTSELARSFFIRNPFKGTVRTQLRLAAPKGWEVKTDGPAFGSFFNLKGGERRVVNVIMIVPPDAAGREVEIIQDVYFENQKISGGAVFEFQKPRG